MGRHADVRAGRRSPAVLGIVVAVVVVAVAATLLVLWTRHDDSRAAGSCEDRQTVRVTVAPEAAGLVERLLDADQRLDDGSCATAEVTGQEPLQTLGSLRSGSLPQVWVPDSSLWADRAGDAPLDAAGQLASSPLVLATSRAAADQLGWTRSAPSWGQALGTGRPLAVPDITASAEGLSALAAVRQSLGGDEDADNAVVQAVLAAGRGEVPSPQDALTAAREGGADAPLVPVSEQELLAADDGGDLVAVYPSDGSPALDYPVLRVGEQDGAEQAAVDAVVAALTAPEAQRAAREAGFRDSSGAAPEGVSADRGVQEQAPRAMRLDPAGLGSLLTRISSLATPTRLLTVIDVSTSMNARVGDGTRVTLARDATKSALALLPDSYSGGVWDFAYRLQGDQDWQELVPLRRFDADAGDGKSQRQAIDEQFDTLPDRLAPGGTALYDTTLAAVRAARDAFDPQSVNSVVLITDGKNEDDAGIQLPALLDTLRAEADPQRPVKVIGIALGPDADLDALRQIGDATGGAAYPALDPNDLQSVLFDAIRRRG
ncbi:substrate-binding domain-containing protein [Modestobacter sp. NPDC049651]|uniref:substrate-binding domain-containing protein n=1 Tax=unclassified Modestobacter TaxID=2643866 RepID=UPI00340018F3